MLNRNKHILQMMEIAEAPRSSSSATVEFRTFYVNSYLSFAKGCSARAVLQRKPKKFLPSQSHVVKHFKH